MELPINLNLSPIFCLRPCPKDSIVSPRCPPKVVIFGFLRFASFFSSSILSISQFLFCLVKRSNHSLFLEKTRIYRSLMMATRNVMFLFPDGHCQFDTCPIYWELHKIFTQTTSTSLTLHTVTTMLSFSAWLLPYTSLRRHNRWAWSKQPTCSSHSRLGLRMLIRKLRSS